MAATFLLFQLSLKEQPPDTTNYEYNRVFESWSSHLAAQTYR
jgi:hypothetical protein